MSTLCIIPARGGSKRIPHKNIMGFNGKPMIAYSIEAVIESKIADEIMVSTDDEEIAIVAKAYGAKVPFFRSKENANDQTGIADVLIEVVNQYQKMGMHFDFIVCILATAPLVQASNIKDAFEQLISEEQCDSICSVEAFSYPPQRGLVLNGEYLEMLHPENYYARSQDLQKMYHDCGQFFIFRTNALMEEKKLYTRKMKPFYIDESESQDIDNYTDLRMAELKYNIMLEKRNGEK